MAKEYKKKMRGAEGDKYRLDNQHQVLAVSTTAIPCSRFAMVREKILENKNISKSENFIFSGGNLEKMKKVRKFQIFPKVSS